MRVVVTGANRGLGREVVRQLVTAGHEVFATARSVDGPAVAQGLKAKFVRLDVTAPASIRAAVDAIGPVDVVIANAGVSLDGFDAKVARRTIDVNYHGAVRVADAFAPAMPAGGRIVFVSSAMGELDAIGRARRHFEGDVARADVDAAVERFVADVIAGTHRAEGWPTSAYRVSKAALNTASRAFARDWPALRVNAVCPGWVATDMGGRGAPRTVAVGARGIVWAATKATGTGGFFRDGEPIGW